MTLIGTSDAIRKAEEDIASAAPSSAKVLITGETGVGKEVVARLIHGRSARRLCPMVTVNCAGVPDTLLESELFGHDRGSFTGAYRDKPGLLEAAANGTVFLDEVGEMSTRMQAVLLRFLETGELQRVGTNRAQTRVDVRVIAATNRDLLAQVASGAFREDLYYRLNVIRIAMPPLRERRGDVPALLDHFFAAFSEAHRTPRPEISDAATEALTSYHWPGNIRELKNCAERIVIRAAGKVVMPRDLPPEIRIGAPLPARDAAPQADLAAEYLERIARGESFWTVVYPPFMRRDLTRDTLREVVSRGLRQTAGNYRLLVSVFNMPPADYKRFLSFLRKYDCQVPFRSFRTPAPPQTRPDAVVAV
ncbi:MAG TPA: sigma-54 dependent transcriptional regulator [Vicinamibacterales bacterium]